jgi:hypothetical protein
MTSDEIIELAKRDDPAGEDGRLYSIAALTPETLARFATLVAEHERNACAKVCEDIDTEYEGEDVLATWCAAAIRART